jgi:hypothetical protein
VETHARRYKKQQNPLGCHGLVPWRFTLNAISNQGLSFSRKREPPRHKAVASQIRSNVLRSKKRESPRHKAVASVQVSTQSRRAALR